MAQEKKVQAAMTDAGLYREGEAKDLRSQFIEQQDIQLAGKSYTLSRISYLDARIFTQEIDTILVQQNPLIHEIFAKNAVSMFDAVRMANLNSKQGFKGALASGNELDFTLFMARQFQDPDGAVQTRRTSWVRTISSVGSKHFFEDLTGAVAEQEQTMGEEEAMVFLGFYNPALQTSIDALQITMNTEPFDIQSLDFEQVHTEKGDVIIELKEPWTLPPEQSGKIEAYYYQTGTDETRPLGIFIQMAKNLRSLATP